MPSFDEEQWQEMRDLAQHNDGIRTPRMFDNTATFDGAMSMLSLFEGLPLLIHSGNMLILEAAGSLQDIPRSQSSENERYPFKVGAIKNG